MTDIHGTREELVKMIAEQRAEIERLRHDLANAQMRADAKIIPNISSQSMTATIGGLSIFESQTMTSDEAHRRYIENDY